MKMITSTLRSAVCSLMKMKVFSVETFSRLSCLSYTNVRSHHITSNDLREFRVDNMKFRARDTGKRTNRVDGEISKDVTTGDQSSLFPDASTPDKLIDGVPFKLLPIINIKATPNNTIMSATSFNGKGILIHSAGIEGFKNTKKGTNIAAQQAAVTFGTRAIEKGIKTVRVRVQGLGAGRMAAMKGLQLAGVNIISITDNTRVTWNPLRPRKARRV
ncbi:30S ribosomal protein S11 [Hylaeus anthracinus]|uniref:30S ribosomal protein S11 n=1 Tax=Hylaeus anthracinus TaxID=313031 RepID=UPI0023B8ACA9|nr:30S ribosomal protein S11 [Hylaeus anthracinus]